MAAPQYAEINRFVLASDLDGTLIDHDIAGTNDGPDEKLREFARLLAGSGERLTLWFNSSRPVASQRASLERIADLPAPAFHIGAMGTQVADTDGQLIEEYGREQFGDWPRAEVEAVAIERFGLVPHALEMQTDYKASFDLPEPIMAQAIEGELQSRGIAAKLVVSSGKDLDILPPRAGKASAIRWLARREDLPFEAVIVSGDSANDIDMFDAPFRGIVVGNGHDELRAHAQEASTPTYLAAARAAGGVIEGLRYFKVFSQVESR